MTERTWRTVFGNPRHLYRGSWQLERDPWTNGSDTAWHLRGGGLQGPVNIGKTADGKYRVSKRQHPHLFARVGGAFDSVQACADAVIADFERTHAQPS